MQLDELFTLIEYGLQELEYEAPLKDEDMDQSVN